MKNTKKNISIEKLHPFENHPYKVQDNEEMDALAESIKMHGVVSPVIVRPLENTTDEYEIKRSQLRRFRTDNLKERFRDVPQLFRERG